MTRLAFRMDLLSNQVKGERFWPGFCFASSLDIPSARLFPRSWLACRFRIANALCFYINRHRLISCIPLLSSPPHPFVPLVFGTQGREESRTILEIFGDREISSHRRFYWCIESLYRDNIEIGRFPVEKENDTVFTALSPFECRNNAARLAFAEHFTATSRGQPRHSSLTLPWPSLRRNSDLPIPSTGHPSPFFFYAHQRNAPVQSSPYPSIPSKKAFLFARALFYSIVSTNFFDDLLEKYHVPRERERENVTWIDATYAHVFASCRFETADFF